VTRKEANMEIIRLLVIQINQQRDVRFGQLLRNAGVIVDISNDEGPPRWSNHFYEESDKMLERMVKNLKGEET
jgi:hypothetical protein